MTTLEKLKNNIENEIKLHPEYPDLLNLMGLLQSVERLHDTALAYFENALSINPYYAEAKVNRLYAMAATGKTSDAAEGAKELAEQSQGAFSTLVVCGKLLTWLSDSGSAVEILRKACDKKPNNPAAHHYLGLALLEGSPDEAAASFEKAASLGTAFIALYDTCQIYKKGRIKLSKQAAEKLKSTLDMNPNTVKVYINAAEMLASEGKFDDAESMFEKARAVEPDSSTIENGLGLVAVSREYGEEAKLHFKRALHFDPGDISSHVNLAFQYGSEGEIKLAEEQIRKAVELAPRYPDIRVQLATILMESEQFEEAITHLQEALAINPNYTFASFMLGSILFIKKRYPELIEAYGNLSLESIDIPEVYSHLATAHLELDNVDKAVEIASKAVKSGNALPSTYVCLVIANHKLGKYAEALGYANEYAAKFPDGPEIDEIKKFLELLKNQ